MSGGSDLNKWIATIRPELRGGTCVFVIVSPGGANLLGPGAVISFPEEMTPLRR
ncbi:hypothetical protein GGE65_008235 [Skermanella aerolata]|uniref:hypothetical protein n=1 Tax=Skermanella aerolata TaxID=393310 RepID=UPI003D1C52EE